MNRSIIREGTWLYDNEVPSKIAIEYRDVAYGSGDYEDSVKDSEDRSGEFFYIISYSPTEEERVLSETGPFDTLSEAEAHCVNTTNGTINWQSK